MPASAALVVWSLLSLAPPVTAQPDLGPGQAVAPGVALFHLTEQALLDPPAALSIWLLRVDVRVADLRPVLANDEIVDTETVPEMALRYSASAAVNAGFFLLPSGDPAGIYKLRGQLVSDTTRPRGAVGIVRRGHRLQFIFGRVAASMTARIHGRARSGAAVDIGGVDTTRERGQLMLYTPAFHADTRTAPGGLEWVLEGNPLRVVGQPRTAGSTRIPPNGFVLSFGGPRAPPALASVRSGTRIDLKAIYSPVEGRAEDWARADDIIGGAGLLIHDGQLVQDWTVEQLGRGFAGTRHPRTLIGTHDDGSVWLVTVDGRQPQLSAGMTLVELQALATRLGLINALNLDGGGSTTMWVNGRVVNSPSDPTGPRKVSDALLVLPRPD